MQTPSRRPGVTLKLATSLDGRIATASGESQWITGEAARLEGHRLRAAHDVVLVGIGTVLADDPTLTVRLPGQDAVHQPLRVILDSRLRMSPAARAATAGTLILTTSETRTIGDAEVRTVAAGADGRCDPAAVLALLAGRGARSVLIEGGGMVAASFVRAGLVDRLEWFRAPLILGGDARPGVAALALAKLADAPTFRRMATQVVGDDLWERFERL